MPDSEAEDTTIFRKSQVLLWALELFFLGINDPVGGFWLPGAAPTLQPALAYRLAASPLPLPLCVFLPTVTGVEASAGGRADQP